jgi:DNA-binding NtrC family response regulator
MVLPVITDAKRAVAKSGDPQLLATLRLQFAKIEAHRRSLREAKRHLLEAGTLLRDFPNLCLSAKQQLGICVVAMLGGELEEALDCAQTAIRLSESAGHERTRRAGLVNLSHVLCARGELSEARQCIEDLLPQLKDDLELRVAALDSLANVVITLGHSPDASDVIAEIEGVMHHIPQEFRPRSYELALSETRARNHLVGGNVDAALQALAPAEPALSRDAVWAVRLRILRIEIEAAASRWGRIRPTLNELAGYELSQEARGRIWLALHAAPVDFTRRRSALRSLLRFCDLTHRRKLAERCADALEPLPLGYQTAIFPALLDRIDEVFAAAVHPLLLAEEVLATLVLAGCISRGAVVSRQGESVRIITSHDWRWDSACDDRVVLDCGTRHSAQIEVVADLADSLDAQCTAAAIRRLVTAARALQHYQHEEQERAALWPSSTVDAEGDSIWRSDTVRDVLEVARRAAGSRATILITGETGTGKEVLARLVHSSSMRAAKPFIAFNCSATPRELLESQLFGYRKGAFTGADSGFSGVSRAAEGGTLFLDEIGDIPLELQPKLLRFLENREIHPLGEAHPTRLDVRVIAATNVNLEDGIAAGRFREDLFYRLNVVPLHLPPLRDRREEIPALAGHFIRRFAAEEGKGNLTLADDALECLLLYRWPGNVRQLANEINRIVAVAEPGSVITAASLAPEIRRARGGTPAGERRESAAAPPIAGFHLDPDEPMPDAVERLERLMVERALKKAGGRVEEAAKLLGISRKGLFLKRRRWGMAPGTEGIPAES